MTDDGRNDLALRLVAGVLLVALFALGLAIATVQGGG